MLDDPVAPHAARIIEHMNHDHADALRDIVRHYAGIDAMTTRMVSCDHRGFAFEADGRSGRIEFPEALTTAEDARRVLVEMTRCSRVK